MIRALLLIGVWIIAALVFTIAPMPPWIEAYRPDWLLLVLIYWAIALPRRVNVGVAWLTGLFLDILVGNTLGVSALILSIVVYISNSNHLTIRNLSVWQQAVIIGLITAFYHLADYWVQHFLTTAYFFPEILWPVLTNTILWPWLFSLMRRYRRRLRVR